MNILSTHDGKALQERYSKAVDETIKTLELIDERLKLIEQKEAAWQVLESRIAENAEKAGHKIKLDVGGKIFATTKATLLKLEGTYFHAMLASGQWQPDDDGKPNITLLSRLSYSPSWNAISSVSGVYFIDVNPKNFDQILDFMRTGELSFDGLQSYQIQNLKKSLDYFQLPIPEHYLLSWDPKFCGRNLTLTENNITVSKDRGGNGWNSAVLGLATCSRFCVRLDATSTSSNVMIGFALRQSFNVASINYNRCEWYFYAHNGSLYSQNGDSARSYASALRVGQTLTAIWDREHHQISFEVDGRSCGVAFNNIPDAEDIFPAVDFYDQGIQLSLMN